MELASLIILGLVAPMNIGISVISLFILDLLFKSSISSTKKIGVLLVTISITQAPTVSMGFLFTPTD